MPADGMADSPAPGASKESICATCQVWPPQSASKPSSCTAGRVRLLVVGDVHGDWDEDDEAAVEFLRPDATIFVGDFGEEDAALVGRVAGFAHRHAGRIAVLLGNHDAW